jgi:hypothetical protein
MTLSLAALRAILAALFVAAVHPAAFAVQSDSVFCSGGTVSLGDPAGEVIRKCGQPAYAVQREQIIGAEGGYPGERIATTVVIDDWTFNFGPDRFQYRLILRNGRLRKIESLQYGY